MSEINERETFEYFTHGCKKASKAAMELATLNEREHWYTIVRALDQMMYNANKLYTAKAMTRMQLMNMAAKIQAKVN